MKCVMTTCPYLDLKTNLCVRYETRPSCCRTFPRRDAYCENSMCKVPDADCTKCKAMCCRNVVVPEGMSIDEVLDMSCEKCATAMPYPPEFTGMLIDEGEGPVRTVKWEEK